MLSDADMNADGSSKIKVEMPKMKVQRQKHTNNKHLK